jgi:hypothetical protein
MGGGHGQVSDQSVVHEVYVEQVPDSGLEATMPFPPLGICERYPKWAMAAWKSSQGCTPLKVAEVVVCAPAVTRPAQARCRCGSWLHSTETTRHFSSAMHARATYQGHRIAAHGISAIWAYAPSHNRRSSCTTGIQVAGVYALCNSDMYSFLRRCGTRRIDKRLSLGSRVD